MAFLLQMAWKACRFFYARTLNIHQWFHIHFALLQKLVFQFELLLLFLFEKILRKAIQFSFYCCDAYRHCSCSSLAGIACGGCLSSRRARYGAAFTHVIVQGMSRIQYQGQMVSCPAFAPFVFLIHTCLPFSHLRLLHRKLSISCL